MVGTGLLTLVWSLWGAVAAAGDLEIRAAGASTTVVLDGRVIGQTPLTLKDLKEGDVVLGFRDAPLGATAFTQTVRVPATGLVVWEVDLAGRVARPVNPADAPSPVTPMPVTPSATPVAAPSKSKGQSGDLYVTSTPVGAAVWLDGKATEQVTPVMLRGLSVGPHKVEVRTTCARASAEVAVTTGVIARSELSPVEGTGALQVDGSPKGAMLWVDGAEAGAIPVLAQALSCGEHRLAVRAPGFLETSQTVSVPAFETTLVQIDLRKEEFGTLVVDVIPLEAVVLVDGVDIGAGPRTVERVATGAHRVEGVLDGYETASRDVTVEANQIARANLSLERSSVKPVKPPRAPRPSRGDGPSVGRVALNTGVSLAAVGAGTMAWRSYADASAAYDLYLAEEDAGRSQAIYEADVRPGLRATAGYGSAAGLGAIAAVVLWVKTDF